MQQESRHNLALQADDPRVERAFRLALKTVDHNIVADRSGLLDAPAPVLYAGDHYQKTWTRDVAFNAWNGEALINPAVTRASLLSVLERRGEHIVTGGEYWDAISWVIGAWQYILATGDRSFLSLAYRAAADSLAFFERTEQDPATGLFRGPACFQDGISGFPAPYNDTAGSSASVDYRGSDRIRWRCLSTNCLYAGAYDRAARMADALGRPGPAEAWRARGRVLRQRINEFLWMEDKGRYAYFLGDRNEKVESMEGVGHALAILLGVAPARRVRSLLDTQHITPYGIPCLWPVFDRFRAIHPSACGRHNGTIWPFINAFWAEAAARHGRVDLFAREWDALLEMVLRHGVFYEIYHPETGEPYGGCQMMDGRMQQWPSEIHQTWSATGYLRMVLHLLCGIDLRPHGIGFDPVLPPSVRSIRLDGLRYRGRRISIRVRRGHGEMRRDAVNDRRVEAPFLSAEATGDQSVDITLPTGGGRPQVRASFRERI